MITIVEKSASGSTVGEPSKYTLEGKNLVSADDKKVAGTIENFDENHSWDNLRIRWEKDAPLNRFDAPVHSTYML